MLLYDHLEGEHTPRSCMLKSVATILHKTHRKCRVNKEMEGWEMGGRPEPLPCVGDDVDECSETMHRGSGNLRGAEILAASLRYVC